MMFLAGLILLLAGQGWFAAAGTVGLILLLAGAFLEVLPLAFMIVAGIFTAKGASKPNVSRWVR